MPARIDIRRAARIPDPTRVARCRRAPELGPNILFFSGGSALAPLGRVLKDYTHNSVHLVTPFDSGGSSAELRRAFHMLSVGDLRYRQLSLADQSAKGNAEVCALFAYRLPNEETPAALARELDQLLAGEHPLLRSVPEPRRQVIRTQLRHFAEQMPRDFDLRRASVGNLVLAGGYLDNNCDIEAVAFLFSQLVGVRGTVRPVVNTDSHLAARLESGQLILGQHRITGKERSPIQSPIAELFLVRSLEDSTPASVTTTPEVQALIRDAELICFPMGSFYSSIIANLLPRGVGRAIAQADCPKLYVPNMGCDPEQVGMSLASAVESIVAAVRSDAGEDTRADRILTSVVIDSESGSYETPLDLPRIKEMGIDLIDAPLVRHQGPSQVDAVALSELLVSLV